MSTAHEALWAGACVLLREKYGDERFERWLAPLKVVSRDGPKLVLAVAGDFMRDWIERHYARRIAEALECAGGKVTLELKVAPERFVEVAREEALIFRTEPPSSPPPPPPGRRAAVEPTLESFVVGVCNRFGYNAALQVLECPGRRYNPLFVHGPTGVGKSHLLKALVVAFRAAGSRALKRFGRSSRDGAPRVKYITAEDFTNEFLHSLHEKTLGRFRERFRSLDLLAIDDIQTLVTRKKTLQEFLHTFNALVDTGRQVVLGCEVAPSELSGLSRAMMTRFVSGLVVELKRPDHETRLGILRRHAARLSHRLDGAVLEAAARRIRGNVRELIGALMQIDIHARLDGAPDGVEKVERILDEFLHHERRQIHAPRILTVVAKHYGLTSEILKSKSRRRPVVFARQVAMYLIRRYTPKSLEQVSVLFGRRSHATARAAERRIAALLESDSHFVHELDEIVGALEEWSGDGAGRGDA